MTTPTDTTTSPPQASKRRRRYDYAEVARVATSAPRGAMRDALVAHFDVSAAMAYRLISIARDRGYDIPPARKAKPAPAPATSVAAGEVAAGLGPIGKLAVDHQAAIDAAAGPPVVIPPANKQAFNVTRRDPPRRPRPTEPFSMDDAHVALGRPADQPVPTPRRNWYDQANCRGVDPELFFPERGHSTESAKNVCRGCDVQLECLTDAMNNGEKFGIWGGLSERERRQLRRRRRANAA